MSTKLSNCPHCEDVSGFNLGMTCPTCLKPFRSHKNVDEPKKKPLKAKPYFYACCLPTIQKIGRELGYNIVIHGSMDRDMDLVAIPWSDTPSSHYILLSTIDMYVRGIKYDEDSFQSGYMFSILPGGRSSYVININRGGTYNNYTDEQWYIDMSITPLVV